MALQLGGQLRDGAIHLDGLQTRHTLNARQRERGRSATSVERSCNYLLQDKRRYSPIACEKCMAPLRYGDCHSVRSACRRTMLIDNQRHRATLRSVARI